MPAARGPYRVDLQNPVADHPLNRGLIGWWLALPHLTGGRRLWDLCNRIHGSMSGFPATGAEWKMSPNRFGVLAFDGVDDYVSMGDSAAVEPASAVSLACWAKPTASVAQYCNIVAKEYASPRSYPYVSYKLGANYAGNNRYDWQVSPGSLNVIDSGVSLVTGTGVFLTGTYGDGTAKIYTDGVQRASASLSGALSYNNGRLLAGVNEDIAEEWTGEIGSIHLWNRPLTNTEAAFLYQEWLRGYPTLLRRYPERSWFVLRESAAAAAGATIPVFAHHYRMQGIQ